MDEAIFGISPEQLLRAALVFLRIGGLLFAMPVFGDASTPVRVRLLLTGALAICFYGLVPARWAPNLNIDAIGIGVLIFKEMLIGISMGFVARIMFETIMSAATLVGFQMGFGTADLLFPDAEQAVNGFSALHRALVILFFLGLNLHHLFIKAIADTFTLIPAGGAWPRIEYAQQLVEFTASLFTISIELSAPILIALLFAMAALGLIARTVPQMNVFTMSFPLSFFIGLLVYAATFPMFPGWMESKFLLNQERIMITMRAFVP